MAEQAAALPDSVLSIGEQLQGGNGVMPAAELFQDRGVFAAEYARIFLRPWTAVEHASRFGWGNTVDRLLAVYSGAMSAPTEGRAALAG